MFLFYLMGDLRTSDTKEDRARVTLVLLDAALEAFKEENGRYPTMEEGLQASTREKDAAILDPWGSPYIYLIPSLDKNKSYSLYSIGPNKTDEKGRGDDIVCCEDR
jgi:general secretion pathway protein G